MMQHNPRRAQKMMRGRVLAQGATLAAFVYYVGLERVDFSILPNYFQMKKLEKEQEEREKSETS